MTATVTVPEEDLPMGQITIRRHTNSIDGSSAEHPQAQWYASVRLGDAECGGYGAEPIDAVTDLAQQLATMVNQARPAPA